MQNEGIQHIHAHYATHPALVAWVINQITGISYSITVHAHDIFVCTAMLETKLRDASFVAAISEFNRSYLNRVVGSWVNDKVYLVHCGIDPTQYQAHRPERDIARFEIISIGSLQPYKGFPYLIQACAGLRDRAIPFRCRIIGGGELYSRLEDQITQAGLDGQVELLGPLPQEEIYRLLPTADCYVQPSIITPSGKMEGIPVSIMEALACALPVVATSISGIPELVRPEETGYLVDPADSSALADALTDIYHSPDRASKLGQAGRKLVLEEFTLSENVKEMALLFEKVSIDSRRLIS
jgi:glycosyltransferase involved in cell wall biosynthesis